MLRFMAEAVCVQTAYSIVFPNANQISFEGFLFTQLVCRGRFWLFRECLLVLLSLFMSD